MLRLAVLFCLVVAYTNADASVNLGSNPFAVNMCDGTRCVGYEHTGVTIWIYSVNSYENDTTTGFTLDDDDYLSASPTHLYLCRNNSTCPDGAIETISLQNATFTNLTPTKVEFEGKKALAISYSLQQNDRLGREVQVNLLFPRDGVCNGSTDPSPLG